MKRNTPDLNPAKLQDRTDSILDMEELSTES